MKRRSVLAASALVLAGSVGLTSSANAGHWGGGHFGGGHLIGHWASPYHFHYSPVGWRSGFWVHGWRAGRLGWWWPVGGAWLMYDAPIYPYPDPALAPAYVVDDPGASGSWAPQGPSAPVPRSAYADNVQAAPPAPTVRYYCDGAHGYYPEVPSCPTGWQKIPLGSSAHP